MPRPHSRSYRNRHISPEKSARKYRGADPAKPKAPNPHDPTVTTGQAHQGKMACPECGAIVTIRKAATGDVNEFGLSIYRGDKDRYFFLSSHRYGGGRPSVAKGHPSCLGCGVPVSPPEIIDDEGFSSE